MRRAANLEVDSGPATAGIGVVAAGGNLLDETVLEKLGSDRGDGRAADPGLVGQRDAGIRPARRMS
ncbi:hypothetical protein ACFSZS_05175 [Seohaeicola zhoushanensis]